MSSCNVCCENYNGTSHIPYFLPACGHTFCKPCLDSIKVPISHPYFKIEIRCPYCRHVNQLRGFDIDLKRNMAILDFIDEASHSSSSSAANFSYLNRTMSYSEFEKENKWIEIGEGSFGTVYELGAL